MKKNVIICIIIILVPVISLTSCAAVNKITFEQWNEKEINLNFERLNTRKTYNLFLSEKDIILVDINKDRGILNLYVYDENNKEIYRGNTSLANNFVLGIPEEGLYKIELDGNNARGSFKIEVK